MRRIEINFCKWIENHCLLLAVFCVVIASAVIRFMLFPYVSDDMEGYLLGWYGQIEQLGQIHALGTQVGNYSVAYQTIIALMTYIPIEPIVAYKVFSCIFDYILALAVFFLIYEKEDKASVIKALFAFIIVVLSPVVFMNSAMWGQCDSIYTSFVILSFVMYKKEKYPLVFMFLGLAFSFKLQTIFYLPFYLFVYVREKKYSILNFFLVPLVMIIMCIPAYIMGRGFKAFASTYYYQTESCDAMSFNYPSFWTIISSNKNVIVEYREAMKYPAIILTFALLALLMLGLIRRKINVDEITSMILFIILAFVCVEFLPGMHERYAYPIEIMAIVLAIKERKTIPMAVWLCISSLITYGCYFFETDINMPILGICNLIVLLLYCYFAKKHISGYSTDVPTT